MVDKYRLPYEQLPECNPEEHPDCTKESCFIFGGECHKRVPECCECHNFDGKSGCFARPQITVSVNDKACYKFQMEVE